MFKRRIRSVWELVLLTSIKREAKKILGSPRATNAQELEHQIRRAADALNLLAPMVTSMEVDLESIRALVNLKPGQVVKVHLSAD